MNDNLFELFVKEGLESIPVKFRKELNNLNIVIEDYPNPHQLKKLNLRPGHSLYGLYEGIPQVKRGSNYGGVLPDKITIFRIPIVRACKTVEDVRDLVIDTVWHEIGHHFGLNEEEVRAAEKRRKGLVD